MRSERYSYLLNNTKNSHRKIAKYDSKYNKKTFRIIKQKEIINNRNTLKRDKNRISMVLKHLETGIGKHIEEKRYMRRVQSKPITNKIIMLKDYIKRDAEEGIISIADSTVIKRNWSKEKYRIMTSLGPLIAKFPVIIIIHIYKHKTVTRK